MSQYRESRHPPGEPADFPVSRSERTYYRGNGIWVTDRWLLVNGERYDMADLYHIWMERGVRGSIGTKTVLGGMCALAFSVGWSCYLRSLVLACLAVLLVLVAGLITVLWKNRHRRYELWAEYQDDDVQILTLPRYETYGRICRAIVRAREARLETPGPPNRINFAEPSVRRHH